MRLSKTKCAVLLEAFKQFATKPYDQVTFTELESSTGLSRGAILYHIKNKENLFRCVIDDYVLSKSILTATFESEIKNYSLWNFIQKFIEVCTEDKNELKEMGIANPNLAMLTIEIAAFYYYPMMREKAEEWYENDLAIWVNVLEKAIKEKEIKEDIDIKLTANLFTNIYLGTSHSGISKIKGYDINLIKKEFQFIYNTIKI